MEDKTVTDNPNPENEQKQFDALYRELVLSVKNSIAKYKNMDDRCFLDGFIYPQSLADVMGRLWKQPDKYIDRYLKKHTKLSDTEKSALSAWKKAAEAEYVIVQKTERGLALYRDGRLYDVVVEDDPAYYRGCVPGLCTGVLLPFGDSIYAPKLYFENGLKFDTPSKQKIKDAAKAAKKADLFFTSCPNGIAVPDPKKPPMGVDPDFYFDMRVYPEGYGRSIYREFLIPIENSFDDLATDILGYYDFDWDHLYEFVFGKRIYSRNFTIKCSRTADLPWCDDDPDGPDTSCALNEYVGIRSDFLFHYDFGDDWVFHCHVKSAVAIFPGGEEDPEWLLDSRGKLVQYPSWDDDEDEEDDGDDESDN